MGRICNGSVPMTFTLSAGFVPIFPENTGQEYLQREKRTLFPTAESVYMYTAEIRCFQR